MLTTCAICSGTGRQYNYTTGKHDGPTCWLCDGSGLFDWDRWHAENGQKGKAQAEVIQLRRMVLRRAQSHKDYLSRCWDIGIWPSSYSRTLALRVQMRKEGVDVPEWKRQRDEKGRFV